MHNDMGQWSVHFWLMHLAMWILLSSPCWTKEFWWRKGLGTGFTDRCIPCIASQDSWAPDRGGWYCLYFNGCTNFHYNVFLIWISRETCATTNYHITIYFLELACIEIIGKDMALVHEYFKPFKQCESM